MKALVTVELQLCGDLFLSFGCSDRGKNKIDILLGARLVSNNTIVIEVANDRKIQYALSCLDVRNVCYPLLVGPVSVEISVAIGRSIVAHWPTTPDSKATKIAWR